MSKMYSVDCLGWRHNLGSARVVKHTFDYRLGRLFVFFGFASPLADTNTALLTVSATDNASPFTRAQSCAIALRSPASERSSDLERYSPDIQYFSSLLYHCAHKYALHFLHTGVATARTSQSSLRGVNG